MKLYKKKQVSIKWTIVKADYLNSFNGFNKVIIGISWKAEAFGMRNSFSSLSGYVKLDTTSLNDFIPYDAISEGKLLQWVNNALGKAQINNIENKLKSRIDIQVNPSRGDGLPFN